MFDNALNNLIKKEHKDNKEKEESKEKENKDKNEPQVKQKLIIDIFEKKIKNNKTAPINPKIETDYNNSSNNNVPKTMSMAARMKLFESKSANNQNKPPIAIGTTKKVDKLEKQEKIHKNKIDLIEERINNKNKAKEPEKINEPPKTGSSSFADRMKFLQNNSNVIVNQIKTNVKHMSEKPQTASEPQKEEPINIGSFEERQQKMRMRLMTMPGMGMMKSPALKKEVTEQDKEDDKQEIELHKAVENIQNKPVRKVRRKTMAPKFNFDSK